MRYIRTITLGLDPDERAANELEACAREVFSTADAVLAGAGRATRTRRLLLPPMNARARFSASNLNSVMGWLREVGARCEARWFNVPFTVFVEGSLKPTFDAALEVVRRYPNAFVNFIVAEGGRIESRGALEVARFMIDVSRMSANGYDNFRIGASCNCAPGGAFFPFAHHDGAPSFSLALELPQLFHSVLDRSPPNASAACEALYGALTQELTEVDELAKTIARDTGVIYRGIDASLAPYPAERGSVGQLVERLGVEEYGCHGTLYTTARLTDVLRRGIAASAVKSVGFNGVMDSMLEDPVIAQRGRTKSFDIDSLLAFAAVCGCGLDMIPVPGDVLVEELASMIIDVAGLSSALNKPLGARLLPIPGRSANELTEFGHDFLYNCRVLPVRNRGLVAETFTQRAVEITPLKNRAALKPSS